MSVRALNSSWSDFVGRLARLEKPLEIAAVITIFVATVFMYWIGGHEAASASAFCFIIAVASLPNRFRQIEKKRRGIEVLNRFDSERNPKPL